MTDNELVQTRLRACTASYFHVFLNVALAPSSATLALLEFKGVRISLGELCLVEAGNLPCPSAFSYSRAIGVPGPGKGKLGTLWIHCAENAVRIEAALGLLTLFASNIILMHDMRTAASFDADASAPLIDMKWHEQLRRSVSKHNFLEISRKWAQVTRTHGHRIVDAPTNQARAVAAASLWDVASAFGATRLALTAAQIRNHALAGNVTATAISHLRTTLVATHEELETIHIGGLWEVSTSERS